MTYQFCYVLLVQLVTAYYIQVVSFSMASVCFIRATVVYLCFNFVFTKYCTSYAATIRKFVQQLTQTFILKLGINILFYNFYTAATVTNRLWLLTGETHCYSIYQYLHMPIELRIEDVFLITQVAFAWVCMYVWGTVKTWCRSRNFSLKPGA